MPRRFVYLCSGRVAEMIDADTLKAAIAKARELQPKLGMATDALTKELADAEEAIRGLSLGVAASVVFPSGDHQLCWGKRGAVWQMFITNDYDDQKKPVTNGSRAERLAVADLIRPLVLALCRNVEAEVQKVSDATARTQDYIDQLKALAAPKPGIHHNSPIEPVE